MGVLLVVAIIGGILVYRAVVPDQRSALPSSVRDLSDACGGRRVAFTAAAAHAGRVHPMVIFDTGSLFTYAGMPAELQSDDPARVQLIACVQQDGGSDAAPVVNTCHYVPGGGLVTVPSVPAPVSLDLPMQRGEYTFSVYEARTGRQVGQVRIAGTETSCPEQIAGRAGEVPKLRSQLTLDDFVRALLPFAG
ncbi:MAG TPA: hypothetical protein VGO86_18995 [Candidatus Dormibacteraeota bacterium]